jgi:hypothetical protein
MNEYAMAIEVIREGLDSSVPVLELSTGVGRTQFDTAQAILTSLVDTVDQEMSHNLVSAKERIQQARWLTYVISVAGLLAMVVIYTIIGGLIRRTNQLTQRAHIFHRMMRRSAARFHMMN